MYSKSESEILHTYTGNDAHQDDMWVFHFYLVKNTLFLQVFKLWPARRSSRTGSFALGAKFKKELSGLSTILQNSCGIFAFGALLGSTVFSWLSLHSSKSWQGFIDPHAGEFYFGKMLHKSKKWSFFITISEIFVWKIIVHVFFNSKLIF